MNPLIHNFIEPLSIQTDYFMGDLIKIFVGETAQHNFLKEMGKTTSPQLPAYIAPIDVEIKDVAWHCAQGKNVLINGKLRSGDLAKFIELLHIFGAWSVCGFDTDNELHLVNADIFRSRGFEYK